MPKNSSNEFAFDQLVQIMNMRAKSEGNSSFPSSFQFIDISFLNELLPNEYEDLKIEENFFKNYPHLGSLINWELIGDFSSPDIYSESLLEEFAKTLADWQIDRLVERIAIAHNLLHNISSPIPTVIYFHCEVSFVEFSILEKKKNQRI